MSSMDMNIRLIVKHEQAGVAPLTGRAACTQGSPVALVRARAGCTPPGVQRVRGGKGRVGAAAGRAQRGICFKRVERLGLEVLREGHCTLSRTRLILTCTCPSAWLAVAPTGGLPLGRAHHCSCGLGARR